MIIQDPLQLGRGHRLQGQAEGLKSRVPGDEYGEIFVGVRIICERAVGCRERVQRR